jgi:putative nucleotidyltransferase with HDIG domain
MTIPAQRAPRALLKRRVLGFAWQSFLVIAGFTLVLGWALVDRTGDIIAEDYSRYISDNVRDLVDDSVPPAGEDGYRLSELAHRVEERVAEGGMEGFRLIDGDGTVLYSTDAGELGNALPEATRTSGFATIHDVDEVPVDPSSETPVVAVTTPWEADAQGVSSDHGSITVYKPMSSLEQRLLAPLPMIWGAAGGLAAFVWLSMVGLTWSGERRVVRAQRKIGKLTDRVESSLRDLEQESIGTLTALNAAVDAKDSYTAGHALSVTALAMEAAIRVGLSGDELATLERAALLHDIGKIGVPEKVLLKPSGLTDAEYEVIKQHTDAGARIVDSIPSLRAVVPLVRWHHERWDGDGYPDGLAGEQIPYLARLLAVADALDAMMSKRPYRERMTPSEALRELQRCAGHQFDPEIARIYALILRERSGEPAVPDRAYAQA